MPSVSVVVAGAVIPKASATNLSKLESAETACTAPNAARATALVNKTFFIVLSPLFFIIYFFVRLSYYHTVYKYLQDLSRVFL